MADLPDSLRRTLAADAASTAVTMIDGRVWDVVGDRGVGAFEGLYGTVYDAVVSRPWLLSPALSVCYGRDRMSAQTELLVDWLCDGLDDAQRSTVLDVPCGGGTELRALSPRVESAIGLDLSPSMLERAAHRTADAGNATLVHGDALAMPFRDGSFHGALSVNGLHVMPDPDLFLRELRRVVRADGRLVLTTLVDRPGARYRLIADVLGRHALRVLPQSPPARERVREMFADAGWAVQAEEGTSIVAFRCAAM